MTDALDGDDYIEENTEELIEIIVHGKDEFTRALVLQSFIKFGDDPALERVESELKQAKEEEGRD